MANLLIAHGGAPTAVINASLYGAVMEAKNSGVVSTMSHEPVRRASNV